MIVIMEAFADVKYFINPGGVAVGLRFWGDGYLRLLSSGHCCLWHILVFINRPVLLLFRNGSVI